MSIRDEDRARFVRRPPAVTPSEHYARVVHELEGLAHLMGPQHRAYIERQARRLRVYGECAGITAR